MANLLTRIKDSVIGWARKILPQGATTKQLLDREKRRLKQSFSDSVKEGQLRGESATSVLQRVRSGISTVKRNTGAIIQTAGNAISNIVRDKYIQARGMGYIHISILDSATSFICIGRSSLRWSNNYKPIGHGKPFALPPLHYRCRSKIAPWVDGMEIPESYPKWLENQPEAVQREILGPGRLAMFKNNTLSLRSLVNSSTGRPLTIDQLKRK